jgi:twitching motility protein PilT
MKVHGEVQPVPGDWPVLSESDVKGFICTFLPESLQGRVSYTGEQRELDYSFSVEQVCKVRVNAYLQRGKWAVVGRLMPLQPPSFEELGLVPALKDFVEFQSGIVMIAGPSGSGKTTTLAALIESINEKRPCHIITLEDPIEIVFEDKQAYISQRELGVDTLDFHLALRALLRESPDVISIGEMRDATTMSIALQAAETGHLVFSTVHTAGAYETLHRLMNLVPPHEKPYLCKRLSKMLRAIVAQKLVPRADGSGRVLVQEVLVGTPTVSKLIAQESFKELYDVMSDGAHWGMQIMNQALLQHIRSGMITESVALAYSNFAAELKLMLRH